MDIILFRMNYLVVLIIYDVYGWKNVLLDIMEEDILGWDCKVFRTSAAFPISAAVWSSVLSACIMLFIIGLSSSSITIFVLISERCYNIFLVHLGTAAIYNQPAYYLWLFLWIFGLSWIFMLLVVVWNLSLWSSRCNCPIFFRLNDSKRLSVTISCNAVDFKMKLLHQKVILLWNKVKEKFCCVGLLQSHMCTNSIHLTNQ